jgi:hypothetical protein
MKFIITVLMLIPFLTLSQLRVILGKDTINLKDPSDIQRVVDSINTSHYKIYELERKRIEDSIDLAMELEYKREPSLYYLNDWALDYEKEPDSLLVNRFKIKDSLIYMSDISIRSTDSLFKLRGLNESIDSVKIALIFEDLIFGFLKNNKQKSILVKDLFEYSYCNSGCVKYVISSILEIKYLRKRVLNPKVRNISIIAYKLNRKSFIRVTYIKKFIFFDIFYENFIEIE